MTDETNDDFENEEMRDAIHEAGHAVYGLLHDFGIKSVFVSRDGPRAGAICWTNPWDYRTPGWEDTAEGRTFAERWMVCHLAGIAAEMKWSGGYHEWGAKEDLARFEAVSARMVRTPEELDQYRARLCEMATQFMQDDRNWRGICALALELVRRQSLCGEDAEQVVEAAMRES